MSRPFFGLRGQTYLRTPSSVWGNRLPQPTPFPVILLLSTSRDWEVFEDPSNRGIRNYIMRDSGGNNWRGFFFISLRLGSTPRQRGHPWCSYYPWTQVRTETAISGTLELVQRSGETPRQGNRHFTPTVLWVERPNETFRLVSVLLPLCETVRQPTTMFQGRLHPKLPFYYIIFPLWRWRSFYHSVPYLNENGLCWFFGLFFYVLCCQKSGHQ